MARPKKYPDELVQRGVRLALESGRPIAHIAADLGMHSETLRKKVRQAEADSGARSNLSSTAEREELQPQPADLLPLGRARQSGARNAVSGSLSGRIVCGEEQDPPGTSRSPRNTAPRDPWVARSPR